MKLSLFRQIECCGAAGMVFSSSIFLFFFLPLVIFGYYLLKENYRLYFLLLASLFFYAWGEPKYVLVMLLSITVNYSFGMFIHMSRSKSILSKIFLILSVACNLSILFYFKYLNFTLNTVNRVLNTVFTYRDIVMPIGISFFTFQGMSYVIDLYWKKVSVQKNPAKLAFYISFFPQLIAGPIVRYIDIEEQIYKRKESVEKFVSGAQRFIIGLAKKVIIANNMGYITDQVFSNPAIENTAAIAWLGIICYTFQIYFDFSGYSDMAIGLGRMFGFEFLENFNYPYISKTITEFWRRWHISLSSWFRDYVYIPLGGNRNGNVYANLLFVFIITGFWHGANWQFLVWGLWHGFFLILERLFKSREINKRIFFPLRYALTMLITIIGWVFFRSPGTSYALKYLGIMFGIVKPENVGFTFQYYFSTKALFIIIFAAVASTPVLRRIFNSHKLNNNIIWKQIESGLILVLLFLCIVFVTGSSFNPFIYFRF
jgi:alginate O-acetyltransferase complex protein AlgI